jgi:hypothetical protein
MSGDLPTPQMEEKFGHRWECHRSEAVLQGRVVWYLQRLDVEVKYIG